MKNINKFVFGVFALSALILSSCGSGDSPSSSSSSKTEPPMSSSQKTEPSNSSAPLSSSSTTPASSSSAAPTPTFDHEALKRCFNNLTKYEAQFDFKLFMRGFKVSTWQKYPLDTAWMAVNSLPTTSAKKRCLISYQRLLKQCISRPNKPWNTLKTNI